MIKQKDQPKMAGLSLFGAGSRGRTDTVLLPSDFESDASANSTIPAWCVELVNALYYSIYFLKNQYVFPIFFAELIKITHLFIS